MGVVAAMSTTKRQGVRIDLSEVVDEALQREFVEHYRQYHSQPERRKRRRRVRTLTAIGVWILCVVLAVILSLVILHRGPRPIERLTPSAPTPRGMRRT